MFFETDTEKLQVLIAAVRKAVPQLKEYRVNQTREELQEALEKIK